ncbi:MAG: hypothetical protein U0992_25235 [Planctomycetaceae bacterium]
MPRSEPLSRPKIAATLAAVALLVGGGLLIPFPWYQAGAVLRRASWRAACVCDRAGNECGPARPCRRDVAAGDPLVTLRSPEPTTSG